MFSLVACWPWLLGACCCGGTLAGSEADSPAEPPAAQANDPPLERVEMLDGRAYFGYVESEDQYWVNLIQIHRPKGQPMYLVIRPLERSKVATVVRPDPLQRAQLHQRIEQFVQRARIETGRMESVRLGLVVLQGTHFRRYRGKWFVLESTLDDELTRRVIVRVEQIFTAYRQILAPRTEPQRPLRLVVLGSMAEYRGYLRRLAIEIDSPACYVAEENLVVAGSEMARFGAELAKVKAEHARLEADLKQLEKEMPARLAELARQMQGDGLSHDQIARALRNKRKTFEDEIARKRNELQRVNRENQQKFLALTAQMFTRLYHEAFHAYLENYVYPRQTHDVPLWLNEGLAQVFEAGLLESETLRIDAPEREKLRSLKGGLAGHEPLSLEKLLSADRASFRAGGEANRSYTHAWGLAYYLTFEKHLLGSAAMDRYVQPGEAALAPAERFERLVGMPLAKLEPAWRQYILGLK